MFLSISAVHFKLRKKVFKYLEEVLKQIYYYSYMSKIFQRQNVLQTQMNI